MMGTAIARARELRAALPSANSDGTTTSKNYEGSGANPHNAYGATAVLPQATPTSSRPKLPSIDASFGSAPVSSGGSSAGGGGGSRRQSDLEREIQSISEETAALKLEAAALAKVTGAQLQNVDAIELARTKAELLAAAQRSGVADTPALRAQIDTLAQGYINASSAAELAANKIQDVQDASKAGADSIASVFEGIATGSLTAEQAVGQLIIQILKLSLQKRLLETAEGAGGSVLGGFLSILGSGFAEGGYTGIGNKHEPAGVVHKGEYVMSKAATSAIGVGNLEAMHNAAKRGYSGGGLVTGANSSVKPSTGLKSGSSDGPINISAPITINGSAGTPDQNNDLAKKMAREMEGSMRGVVMDEIRKQQRPGNMMNNRRGR
jgi:phage-related minor tail protein